jgi:maltooligosyltrehalose synthase
MARLPLGEAAWEDTRLELSAMNADAVHFWRNVFTGEVVAATDREGTLSLTAAEMFADFPVALLFGTR